MSLWSKYKRRVGVTGGAGFIGSNLLHYLVPKYPDYLFVNIDCLTYAGNMANLVQLENKENYRFEKIDIRDFDAVKDCFENYEFDGIIHLAAETHVDRSIIGPADFISTNIDGTFNLLEAARSKAENIRFCHISTDEVFGSVEGRDKSTEMSPYRPGSPYAASKAAADHLVRSYHNTYGLNSVISICSNNYGPYQFPEKLIPLVIRNIRDGLTIPLYGDGRHVRDWIYVTDHCRAIDLIFHKGHSGETYNVSAGSPSENVEVVRKIMAIMNDIHGSNASDDSFEYVNDRPGHDRRYALDPSKAVTELGWTPSVSFEEGLQMTISWYMKNKKWLDNCVSGEYLKYYKRNYGNR